MRWFPLIRPLGVALAVGLVAAGLALAGGARALTSGWRVQPSPNPSPYGDYLNGVAATSSTNAWAVGWDDTRTGGTRTLIERWNGKAWRVQPSPRPVGSSLSAVAATSSTNAWAVGDSANGTLIEHWNGKAWKIQPSPNPAGSSGAFLDAVAGTSSIDAWAVGSYRNGAAFQTLVEHWDGTAWTIVSSPNPGSYGHDFLTGVAATSSTDAWAVDDAEPESFIEHWDGTAWTVEPNANTGAYYNVLMGVAATSSTNAWAVGYYRPGTVFVQPLVEHWDGTAWTLEPSPASSSETLSAVVATSSSNSWAVGLRIFASRKKCRRPRCVGPRTLVEHWNGTNWTDEPSPNPSLHGDQLNGVAAASPTNAWAVGDYKKGKTFQTLIEHWHG